MRNQIFHSPGNEEAELAKIPGDGDPPPPHCPVFIMPYWDHWYQQGITTSAYFP